MKDQIRATLQCIFLTSSFIFLLVLSISAIIALELLRNYVKKHGTSLQKLTAHTTRIIPLNALQPSGKQIRHASFFVRFLTMIEGSQNRLQLTSGTLTIFLVIYYRFPTGSGASSVTRGQCCRTAAGTKTTTGPWRELSSPGLPRLKRTKKRRRMLLLTICPLACRCTRTARLMKTGKFSKSVFVQDIKRKY